MKKKTEPVPKNVINRQRSQSSYTTNNSIATSKDKTTSQRLEDEVVMSQITETAIALNNFAGGNDLRDLDQKVKALMIFSENKVDKKMQEQEYARCVEKKDT